MSQFTADWQSLKLKKHLQFCDISKEQVRPTTIYFPAILNALHTSIDMADDLRLNSLMSEMTSFRFCTLSNMILNLKLE